MVDDILAQLAAIRQSLEVELKAESDKRDANDIDQAPTIEPADAPAADGVTKRNAPCPCGSGKRFKHCHGQLGSSAEMEEPLLPPQIKFETAVVISSVQIGNVESLPVDSESTPQISSPGDSDQRNSSETEFFHPNIEPILGEHAAVLSTERKSFSTQDAPQQASGAIPGERNESKAMAMIVAGHVKLKNRRALADLLTHRRKVLDELQAVSGVSAASVVRAVLVEIALIEAGLEELQPPPGPLPGV